MWSSWNQAVWVRCFLSNHVQNSQSTRTYRSAVIDLPPCTKMVPLYPIASHAVHLTWYRGWSSTYPSGFFSTRFCNTDLHSWYRLTIFVWPILFIRARLSRSIEFVLKNVSIAYALFWSLHFCASWQSARYVRQITYGNFKYGEATKDRTNWIPILFLEWKIALRRNWHPCLNSRLFLSQKTMSTVLWHI